MDKPRIKNESLLAPQLGHAKASLLHGSRSTSLISAIAAIGAHDRALGKKGELLWRIPADLKRFHDLTVGHVVIMGRKTWESLPDKVRPLPGRRNIIITRDESFRALGAEVAHSIEDALELGRQADDDEIFVIGGGEIYALALPYTDKLYLTLIDDRKEADVFFPVYEKEFENETFREMHEHKGLKYCWVNLER